MACTLLKATPVPKPLTCCQKTPRSEVQRNVKSLFKTNIACNCCLSEAAIYVVPSVYWPTSPFQGAYGEGQCDTCGGTINLQETNPSKPLTPVSISEGKVTCLCTRVGSRRCGCLVTWFCYQLIAKPGNKTATPPWPNSLIFRYLTLSLSMRNLALLMTLIIPYGPHILVHKKAYK